MTAASNEGEMIRFHTSRHVGVERSPRWVRVEFNGVIVADSRDVKLALEANRPPTYYFPESDVLTERLEPSAKIAKFPHKGPTHYQHLRVGDRLVENAAWSHPDLPSDRAKLAGHIAFKWGLMDAWYEEEEQVYVHPRDPYVRVDAIPSSRQVRIEVDGVKIAESSRPVLVFETGLMVRYYLPPADVKMSLLKRTDTHTRCPYKGKASYYSLALGGHAREDLAWVYREPIRDCSKIKGLLSFYDERVDTYVDGVRQPRP
jgi:uncharacterized protein (DUF427 family)